MYTYIKYSKVNEKSQDLLKLIEKLEELDSKAITDFNTIKESYEGKDADLIVEKGVTRANQLNNYITYMKSYQSYLDWLTGEYEFSKAKADNELNMDQEQESNLDLSGDVWKILN